MKEVLKGLSMKNRSIFHFKDWLTIEETVKHLNYIFNEELTKADILRLILDHHLTLSINFINYGTGKLFKIVSIDKAHKLTHNIITDEPYPHPVITGISVPREISGTKCDTPHFLQWSRQEDLITITGVWDLLLIANGELEVEHMYQMEIDGPAIELVSIDGTYIQNNEGVVLEIQEEFDEKYNFGKDKYFPSASIPKNSQLVIRTASIKKFLHHQNDKNTLSSDDRFYVSEDLSYLNQAAKKF